MNRQTTSSGWLTEFGAFRENPVLPFGLAPATRPCRFVREWLSSKVAFIAPREVSRAKSDWAPRGYPKRNGLFSERHDRGTQSKQLEQVTAVRLSEHPLKYKRHSEQRVLVGPAGWPSFPQAEYDAQEWSVRASIKKHTRHSTKRSAKFLGPAAIGLKQAGPTNIYQRAAARAAPNRVCPY